MHAEYKNGFLNSFAAACSFAFACTLAINWVSNFHPLIQCIKHKINSSARNCNFSAAILYFFPPTHESIANLIRNHFRYWVVCGSAFFRWMGKKKLQRFFMTFSWQWRSRRDNEENYRFFCFFTRTFFLLLRWAIAMRINFQFPFHFLNSGTYETKNYI